MKKLVILIVVVALLATGAYAGFGLITRQQLANTADLIQAQVPDIVEKKIDGGFSSSNIYLKIPLPMARFGDPEIDANLIIEQKVFHGPLVFAKGAPRVPLKAYGQGQLYLEIVGVDIPAPLTELLRADLSFTMPLVGDTTLLLSGNTLNHQFDLLGEKFSCDWQGFRVAMTFTGSSLSSYVLDMEIPGFKVQGEGGDVLALQNMTAKGEMEEGVSGLSVGSMHSSLERLEVRVAELDDHVLAENLQATVVSAEEADRWQMSEEMTLQRLSFDGQNYDGLTLRLALRNLVASQVAAISKAFQELEADPAAQNDPQLAQQRSIAILMEHGPAMLAGSPELALEQLSATTPHGQLSLDAVVKLNGEGEVLLNPFFLLGRLSAEGQLKADKTALEQLLKEAIRLDLCSDKFDRACENQALEMARARLADLVAGNLLLIEGGRYQSQASFKAGQVSVNGAPLPIPLGQPGS